MVQLDDQWNAVGIAPRHRAEHAESRSHSVASAGDGEFYDVGRIEVVWIGRKGSAAGMLDALVDGQQRKIAAAGEAALVEECRELRNTPGLRSESIRTRSMKSGPGRCRFSLGMPRQTWPRRNSASAPSWLAIFVMIIS